MAATSDNGLADPDPGRTGSMTAINSGPVGEVGGVRLPLQSLHGYGSVFMYSASTSPGGGGSGAAGGGGAGQATGEVTLRLREPEDIPEEVLARLEDTATLSISLQGDAVLRLGAATAGNGNLELFDSESGPDLTLSPQTFTSTAEAFINDNSDSLGVPGDNDTGSGEESRAGTGDPSKLGVKKPRPKASSPNRQGPQQCQVCGKVFNNASALTKHKLTHSDERKYVCTMCGKAFKRQDHLNGHMLTHRNKKPYECKAEGCGKSYCDARSLRRHTENHHAGSKVNESTSPSSPATGPNTPNTPGSNPSTPNTPNAAAGGSNVAAANATNAVSQNGHGHTALKQLLASEPAPVQLKGSNGPNTGNDGLTKQQLELIQQIMQQTQQQQQQQQQVTVQSQGQTQQQQQQLLQQQQQQQQQQQSATSGGSSGNGQVQKSGAKPIVKSTTTVSGPIVNAVNANVAANARSSPKPKVWNHAQQQQAQQQAQQQQQQQQQQVQQQQQQQAQQHHHQQQQQQQHQQQQQLQQQQQQQQQTNSPGGGSGKIGGSPSPGNSASPGAVVPASGKSPAEPKPVECNLCHRKFKNIPALNGHMRLHGGYFKKDAENKKSEKKEVVGPPLQTASVSVRALIEEKIIQKRTTATEANAAQQQQQRANVASFTNQVTTTTTSSTADGQQHIVGKMNFAVPAPPPLSVGDKVRRLSDGEHFRQPNVTIAGHATSMQKQLQEAQTQAQAQALADMILKGTTKMAVKRTSSDPNQRLQLTYQTAAVANNNPTQQQIAQQQVNTQQQQQQQQQQQPVVTESFTITGYPEDGGYFSPSLQDEVFQQVTSVPDSVLLHATQLDAIQFQTSGLLQDQTGSDALQDINLEERFPSQHTVNPDLQALVNSPLPDSLVEFSTYGANYNDGSHTLPSQSPLPSPLTRHDSPSFTYPTPPASQEGLLSGSLPLLSPHEDSDAVHSVSSPLSAAFYSTSMSSAAAIEEALSEVLPDETDADGADLYGSGCPNPHSPLPSPLSATPAPSPLSSLPPSSVSSPGPGSFTTSSFPMSPHHTLQSQMMPNSEDPLLSSSPKDFGAGRRKFEFQSYKLITNQNLVDFSLGNGNVAGIVVDNNGEFKLIQTAGLQKANVYVQAGALSPALAFRKDICLSGPKLEQGNVNMNVNMVNGQGLNLPNQTYQQTQIHQQAINPAKFLIQTNQAGKPNLKHKVSNGLPVPVEQIKEEESLDEDIFLNPSTVPITSSGSPARHHKKRPRLEGPLHNSIFNGSHSYPSRLRRACDRHWDSSYTPPPILDPSRPGPGLYARLHQSERDTTDFSSDDSQGNDGPPPRINIGTKYQATIPQVTENYGDRLAGEPEVDHLLWDPGIDSALTETELEMYLQFACCAAVPGGGRNKEYALHLLHMCKGNIREAMLKLMRPTPALASDHPLRSYEYNDSDRWTSNEMDVFYQSLLKYNKDFSAIARDIGSKSTRQCVQFYYLWKRLCPDEYKRLRLRYGKPKIKIEYNKDSKDTKELQEVIASVTELDFSEGKSILHRTLMQTTNERENSATLTTSEGELRLFAYDSQDSFSGSVTVTMAGSALITRAPSCTGKAGSAAGYATVDHTNSQTHTSTEQQLPAPTPLHYPCKICGKVFNKVKSRSAHMKSHRPIPSPDSTAQESRKLHQHQQLQSSVQQIHPDHHQYQLNSIQTHQQQNHLLVHTQDCRQYQEHRHQRQITPMNCNMQSNHLWHNPPRLRPP